MFLICSCFGAVIPQWKQKKSVRLFVLPNRNISRLIHCCSINDPRSKRSHLGYDSSEELLGLAADVGARSVGAKPRSWFGPNGQYMRELPCPSCRGRGYTPCSECGIERSRLDCSQCGGKGIMTCGRCSGECVVWEESIDEQPWEKARSISAFKVKEDDEVDRLDIKLEAKKKSKRVYRSLPPEVGLKISRSLKKAKGTPAARKHASETLKAFFSNPENRLKRSISMKGVRFYCTNCGREGHRKHYCPELNSVDRESRCTTCGEKGHNRRTCPKNSRTSSHKVEVRRVQHCRICGQTGHNQRSCPRATGSSRKPMTTRRKYSCRICNQTGHNSRSCPQLTTKSSAISETGSSHKLRGHVPDRTVTDS
ncbi:DNA-binding protein HEXBP [Linum perenne]